MTTEVHSFLICFFSLNFLPSAHNPIGLPVEMHVTYTIELVQPLVAMLVLQPDRLPTRPGRTPRHRVASLRSGQYSWNFITATDWLYLHYIQLLRAIHIVRSFINSCVTTLAAELRHTLANNCK